MPTGSRRTPFYEHLYRAIDSGGGMFNAHLHMDRYGTLDERYMRDIGISGLETSHISLHAKHSLIGRLHAGPAYHPEDLRARVNACLDILVSCNTRRADTMVDVTADAVGLSALETMSEIRDERAQDIELRLGAYTPLGFCDSEPGRWEMQLMGAEKADFIGSLPEADDSDDYPGNIGFMEHCRRILELATDRQMMVHVHTDQRNEPSESGTERLIEAVREFGGPEAPADDPLLWAVHMISPSTYAEDRFQCLVEGLLECNIGVICCPSAALGMRQLRTSQTPTYNSIPRVLEMLAAGVQVRLASDNIADMCSPSTTADLVDEVFVLSAALRFYHVGILAKLATGSPLDDLDREVIRDHLQQNDAEIAKVMRGRAQHQARQ